jgi:hypothetical protein
MKTSANIKHKASLIIGVCCCALVLSQPVQADNLLDSKAFKSFKVLQFSKEIKIRGFKMSEHIYFGHAKIAGKYGLGLVVDKNDYAWGINHRGISISKKF